MSDRRPEPTKLIVEYQEQTCTCSEPDWCNRNGVRFRTAQRVADSSDLLAVVRRGVESGTIKGEVVELRVSTAGTNFINDQGQRAPGPYVLIPFSDGGEDR